MRQHAIPARIKAVLLFIAGVFVFAACSRPIGYGVLLWSADENAVQSGTIVEVLSESDIQEIYELRSGPDGEAFNADRWRVEFFETQEEAQAAAADYAELATVYARAGRNALPMRSARELKNDNIVYRLREGERIKLVARDAETTDLSGLVSYWYSALTETGIEGYVFGYELALFDAVDPTAEFADTSSVDPLLQMLIGNVWRPIYYTDMIANQAYDLDLFTPEYGLFPDPDNSQLELILPYHRVEFEYETIANVGARKYLAEGTSLQLTFNRGEELSLQYLHEGEQFILAMQRVEGTIEDYIEAELDRRETRYQSIMEQGPVFVSGNYGRVTLMDNRRFIWTGYERLVPTAIPAGLGTQGEVILNLYLGDELTDTFDGAIGFRFDGIREPVSFAYTIVQGGLRMLYIPPTDIDDIIVVGRGASSITLFFSTAGG